MAGSDPILGVIGQLVPQFRSCTTCRTLAPGVHLVEPSDESALIALLSDMHQRVQGRSDFDDDEFREAMEAEGMSFERLVAIPDKDDAGDDSQQVRIELGDLGESLGCLILAAHLGYDCQHLHPKNLIKTHYTISVPGLDIISIRLSQNHAPISGLHPDDQLDVFESKASAAKASSFNSLLGAAEKSRTGITRKRLREELTFAAYKVETADGHKGRSIRLRWFIIDFFKHRKQSRSFAMLHHSEALTDDDFIALGEASKQKGFEGIVMFKGRVGEMREAAFAYRRLKDVS